MKVSGLTLICAFRYALGKTNYVVKQIVDDILANWDDISLITKNQFVEEIQIYQKNYGGHHAESDMQWQRIIDRHRHESDLICHVSKYNEQGFPEIIEIEYNKSLLRYVHFSNDLELKMNNYIKKELSK